jgi:CubicO group peptidase (beta-lactamase class C family)
MSADQKRIFLAATIQRFTHAAAKNRALGWESRDTASTDNSGKLMSATAFGHTGFTGTSIWIDPVRGVFAVVLTNRVYAPRSRRSISRLKAIRGQVADAAVMLGDHACGEAPSRRAPSRSSGC